MLQLTPSQYEALYNLVEGNKKPVDGRILVALRNRGLVNQYGQATTFGWHTVGRFRFLPETDILRPADIDSWQGYTIKFSEDPGSVEYDDYGEEMWSRVERVDYVLDFYKIVQWYAKIQRRVADAIESLWDSELDRDVEHFGYDRHRLLTLRRAALEQALRDDHFHSYTNHIFYDAVASILGHMLSRGSSTSYKYSLQDNEDEFADWLSDGNLPRLKWSIEVD